MNRVILLVGAMVLCSVTLATADPGDTIWTKTYGGIYGDGAYSIQITSEGGSIIEGDTYSYGDAGKNIYLVKTYQYGDTLWTRNYGGKVFPSERTVAPEAKENGITPEDKQTDSSEA